MKWRISATRAMASTVGVLTGLLGIEHGYFETLQGNVAPSSIILEHMPESIKFKLSGRANTLETKNDSTRPRYGNYLVCTKTTRVLHHNVTSINREERESC